MEGWALAISIISIGIAGCALFFSKKANDLANAIHEREKKIEKPILLNAHVNNAENFVFVIEDYSGNKNLRIDNIEFAISENGDYKDIPFEVRRNDKINPSQVTVTTNDKFNILDAYWFKIYTNHDEVLEHKHGSVFTEKNPDD
jgi:hypothetical protein